MSGLNQAEPTVVGQSGSTQFPSQDWFSSGTWRTEKSRLRTNQSLLALAVLLLSTVPLFAQDMPLGPVRAEVATQATPAPATNSDALRNAAQNPIANLISVPLQDNFNIGPADRTQNVLHIQPGIPLKVSKDWNLIVRWITPVVLSRLTPQAPRDSVGRNAPGVSSIIARV
jgi:hypothetical protein